MMTELSRWTEIIIPSRPWYRKKFILGSYIGFFGKQAGRKIWGYHLIRMRRTRNGGRRKEDHRTLKAAATNTDTKSEGRMIQKQCSVTLYSRLQLTHIKFNCNPHWLNWTSKRITPLNSYFLSQVIGRKCRQPQPQATQTLLTLLYPSYKWP